MRRWFPVAALVLFLVPSADATVCINRFLARSDGPKQIVTLLTGKLTYQEAQELSKQHSAITWLDDAGKVVATSIDVKALRPMPVGCDGKTSGVVLQVSFVSMRRPTKKMSVKLGSAEAVEFEEQAE